MSCVAASGRVGQLVSVCGGVHYDVVSDVV